MSDRIIRSTAAVTCPTALDTTYLWNPGFTVIRCDPFPIFNFQILYSTAPGNHPTFSAGNVLNILSPVPPGLAKPYTNRQGEYLKVLRMKKLHLKTMSLKNQSLAKGDLELYLKAANVGLELRKEGYFKKI